MSMNAEEQGKLMRIMRDAMSELIKGIETVNETVEPMVEASKDCDLTVQLFMYRSMDEIKSVCGEVITLMNKGLPVCAERASKIMMAQLMDKIEMFGYVFTPDKENYYSVKKENELLMLTWMKNHPVGKHLVKEAVHHATLKKFFDENFADEGNAPPSFVGMFKKDTLEVRKSKS